MDQKYFSIDQRDNAWILTITRPEVLNALNFELLQKLKEAFLGFKQDPEARILILTGQGQKAFCAGADIQELRGRHIIDEKQGMLLGQETFNTLEEIGKPSIAASCAPNRLDPRIQIGTCVPSPGTATTRCPTWASAK